MNEKPTAEEVARWQRRFASQANNRAWALSEQATRSEREDEEMRHAAHAAMYFWRVVGDAKNQAHAAQLIAHTYAILKQPRAAAQYLERCLPTFLEESANPWERALAHAVAANVASVSGQAEDHAHHYSQAIKLTAALKDAEERAIIEATVRVVPAPAGLRASTA